jgi:2-phosphosulfolactate phosphatase
MMHIDLMASAAHIDTKRLNGATAVVIDVLRATSVMVTAFANGIADLIAVPSPDEAFAMRAKDPTILLGGEKDAVWVPGFDLDNSPFNYTPEKVKGKHLVMSTSNGTRAIKGSETASRLLIGSFLNAAAIIDAVRNDTKVVFVCSGSQNAFTLEDSLCAGYMIHLLLEIHPRAHLSDFAITMHELFVNHQNNVEEFASKGNHYQLLLKKSFAKDLAYCFTPNLFSVVPEWKKGIISI